MSGNGSTGFSLGGFAIALVTVGVGAAAGLTLGPVAGSSYLGMLLGGFLAGLAVEDRPLLEAGVAAVLASLGILVAGGYVGTGIVAAVAALGSIAPTTLLVSIGLSFAVGAFGAHFGDDLRDGLTAPVEESPARARSATRRTSTGTEPEPSAFRTDESVESDDSADHEPADRNVTRREMEEDATRRKMEGDATRREAKEDATGFETEASESRDDVELDRN